MFIIVITIYYCCYGEKMRRQRNIIIWAAVTMCLILLSPLTVAVSYSTDFDDPTDDVIKNEIQTVDLPHVDIKHIKTYEEGENIVFEMTVDGSIQDTNDYVYDFYAMDTAKMDTSEATEIIYLYYKGGVARYMDPNDYTDQSKIGEPDVTIVGNKITMKVPTSVFSDLSNFYVYAIASSALEEAFDFALSWEGTGDDTGDDAGDEAEGDEDAGDGTPGFEVIAVIISVAIALILLRRKK